MINSSLRYTNTYSILNIPQDALSRLNRNPAVAANRIFHNNAYDNLFSRSINNAMNQAVNDFSKTFKASIGGLNQAATTLTSKQNSPFDQTVSTTTSKAFTVTSGVGATLGAYSAQVNRLAKSQVNTSKGFSATSDNVLGSTATFSLAQKGKNSFFNVDLSKAKTNGEALNLVAEAINGRGGGVNAKVTTENGISQLKISSNDTGMKQAFTLTGQFADSAGINQVSQTATNAEATINRKTVTSENNTLKSADGRFTLNATGISTSTESFTVSANDDAVVKALKSFAEEFNKFSDFAGNQSSKPMQLLSRQMDRTIADNRYDLDSIGVTRDDTGKIAINEDKLRQALKDDRGQVERITSGTGSFAQSIERRMTQASRTPVSKFMDTSEMFNYQMNSQKVSLMQNNAIGSILDLSL